MAMNKIAKGDRLPYPNSSGATIAAEAPVLAGKIFGVVCADIADGTTGELDITGVYEVRKATGAITIGADLYWDADGNPVVGATQTGALTTTDSGNTYAGRAYAAAGSSTATVQILLNA